MPSLEITIPNTLGINRNVEEIYQPKSIAELLERFRYLSNRYDNITTVSTGRNWGYGCSAPNRSGGLLINLSACRNISNFSQEHGIVTVEPGVTYGELEKFLSEQGGEWLTPVHGGGPSCSVLGNILERGYGLTPYTDHFGALTSLKAVLASGEIYEGNLSKIGAPHLDRLFRYGIGPYYDGLFTQSGFGIVTEVTIRLAKKPEYMEMFYFNAFQESDLGALVEAIKKSKCELGSNIGGINIINPERMLSMVVDYPLEKIQSLEPLDASEIEKLRKQYAGTPWLVVGMIYGTEGVARATKKRLLRNFSNIKLRKLFYNTKNRKYFHFLSKIFSSIGANNLSTLLQKLDSAFDVLNGKPNNVALKLAYWKNRNKSLQSKQILNPTLDNCGLIWYAPLVEMNASSVQRYVNFIEQASEKFQFNKLITLTTIDDLCFDSTIPILFDLANPDDVSRAHSYYEYLLTEGLKLGFFPYRLTTDSQTKFDFQTDLFKLSLINKDRYR